MKKRLLLFLMAFASLGLNAQITVAPGSPTQKITYKTGTGTKTITITQETATLINKYYLEVKDGSRVSSLTNETTSTESKATISAVNTGSKSAVVYANTNSAGGGSSLSGMQASSTNYTGSLNIDGMTGSVGIAAEDYSLGFLNSISLLPKESRFNASDDNLGANSLVRFRYDSIFHKIDDFTGTKSTLLQTAWLNSFTLNSGNDVSLFSQSATDLLFENKNSSTGKLASFELDHNGTGNGNMWKSTDGSDISKVTLNPVSLAIETNTNSQYANLTVDAQAGFLSATQSSAGSANFVQGFNTIGIDATDNTNNLVFNIDAPNSTIYCSVASGDLLEVFTMDPSNSGNGTGFDSYDSGTTDHSNLFIRPSQFGYSVEGGASVTGILMSNSSVTTTSTDGANTSTMVTSPSYHIIEMNGVSSMNFSESIFEASVATNITNCSNFEINASAGLSVDVGTSSITGDGINFTTTAETIYQFAGATSLELSNTGTLIASPTVDVDGNLLANTVVLDAGTTAKAPFRFTSGTNTTVVSNGSVEYDGANYYASSAGVRYTLAKTLTNTATLNFPSTAAGQTSSLTMTVNGVASGDVIIVNQISGSSPSTGVFTARGTGANIVTVYYTNTDPLSAVDPASADFRSIATKY